MIHRLRFPVPAALAVLLVLGAGILGAAPAQAAGTAPSQPSGVQAFQSGAGSVRVLWDSPTSAGSSPIASYTVSWSSGTANGGRAASTDRVAVLESLPPAKYLVTVTARNEEGLDGPRSAPVPVTVVGSVPTLESSASTATARGAVTLSGIWRAPDSVTIQRRVAGGAWTDLATVTADTENTFSLRATVDRTADYRAHATDGSGDSSLATVTVRNLVSLAASRQATRTYTLYGTVVPGLAGQEVKLYSSRGGAAYALLSTVRTTSAGKYSYKRRYSATATYSFKVVTTATAVNTPGTAVRSVAVR